MNTSVITPINEANELTKSIVHASELKNLERLLKRKTPKNLSTFC